MRRVSTVFIVEFHAMFAMKIISVSMRYGSPRQALVITLCIMPCTDSGYSQENALSMRTGPPSLVDEQIVGLGRPAQRQAGERRIRLHAFGLFGVFASGGMPRGNGALWRKPPGRSMVPSKRHQDRQRAYGLKAVGMRGEPAHRVERDRIAGDRFRARMPQLSVQAIGSSIFWSRAVTPISCARRRMVAAGYAGDSLGPFRRVVLHPLQQQLERRLHRRAVGELELAEQVGIGARRM